MQTVQKRPAKISQNRTKAGFSLTEISIVLGIIGVILGAIWGVASATFENNGVTSVMQEISKSVSNIRDTYSVMNAWPTSGTCAVVGATTITWPGSVNSNVVHCFDGKNLFPTGMRAAPQSPGATTLNHALGGNFIVLNESTAKITVGDIGVRLELQGLKPSACVKLLRQLPLNDTTFGITAIQVIGTGTNCMLGLTAGLGCTSVTGSLPMSVTTASNWCNGAGTTNEVDLDFKLHN